MKSIKAAQSPNINDSCPECGSYMDIGTMVDEGDVVLTLTFSGALAETDAEQLEAIAQARFESVKTTQKIDGDKRQLLIEFSCSAEKLIFQLENGLS